MPEGPDVKLLVENLQKNFNKKKIETIEILSGRYKKKSPDNYIHISENLPLKILNIKCKGKFIYFILENNWYIFNTLGMTGNWILNDKIKHNHIKFKIDNNDVFYNDVRNFGTFKFVNDKKEFDKKIKSLGNDILDKEFTLEYVLKMFNKKNNLSKTLPEVLMNQKMFCGLGNYLKSEILYESKISPHRLVKDLDKNDKEILYKNIKKISKKFYDEGSAYKTSLKEITEELIKNNFEVYKRKKDKNEYIVLRETTKDKRTTFWVKELQI